MQIRLAPLQKGQMLALFHSSLRGSSHCPKSDHIGILPLSSSCAQVEEILGWVPTKELARAEGTRLLGDRCHFTCFQI